MTIRVTGSAVDWGGALPSDIGTIAQSVADCFSDAMAEMPVPSIVLEPTPSPEDPPFTAYELAPDGSVRILLPIRGNVWARLVFQLAHELCHALVGVHPSARADWLEESLCEVASLFALHSCARKWAWRPPYASWRESAEQFEDYARDREGQTEHCLPDGVQFPAWLRQKLPDLQASATANRDFNVVIAKRLLPIFLRVPSAWRTVRHLNSWKLPTNAAVDDLLGRWRQGTPSNLHHFINAFERRLSFRPRKLRGTGVVPVLANLKALLEMRPSTDNGGKLGL